jgi:hypothetical protein
MKSRSFKTAITVFATAATMLSSAITIASSETILVPADGIDLGPVQPNICITKPWVCEGGVLEPAPEPPVPPAAPAPSAGGLSKEQILGLGLIGGVIAGAAIANAAQPREILIQPASSTNAHVDYCFKRYKSYRMEDNSWQPHEGPRKPCISPFL